MIKNMMLFTVIVLSATSASAQCQSELKATDGYKELSGILKCLNGEIATLKAERGLPAAGASQPVSALIAGQTPTGPMSGSIGPLKFDITECRLNGTNVTCVMAITAEKDAKVSLKDGTHLFDDSGDRRNVTSFRGKNSYQYSSSWEQEHTAGVRLVNEIDFPEVNAGARTLARLTVVLRHNNTDQEFIFRSVPLVRK